MNLRTPTALKLSTITPIYVGMPLAALNAVISPAHTGAPRTSTPARAPVAAEMPDAPTPVTPANAAVHIMKVPSSLVIAAFASLQRAYGQQASAEASAAALQRGLPTPAPRPAIDVQA